MDNHKAGFVNIIGKPNVGKSTLMNILVGERLSIISPKAQTTRHRIKGIVSTDDYQIVFSDTPGILKPNYKLHEKMMNFVDTAVEDADLILFITDIFDDFSDEVVIDKLKKTTAPIILLINKIDLSSQDKLEGLMDKWKEKINPNIIIPISALEKFNTDRVLSVLVEHLPFSPPFYPKYQLTDSSERFFVSEIIREKIFFNYSKEIPYSAEVAIEDFKDEPHIVKIRATIFVSRETQKGIIIGHKGASLKKVGTEARIDIEKFLDKKVFLELFVKVKEDWRNQPNLLKNFGYDN
jgi:GTP-binding protein Era